MSSGAVLNAPIMLNIASIVFHSDKSPRSSNLKRKNVVKNWRGKKSIGKLLVSAVSTHTHTQTCFVIIIRQIYWFAISHSSARCDIIAIESLFFFAISWVFFLIIITELSGTAKIPLHLDPRASLLSAFRDRCVDFFRFYVILSRECREPRGNFQLLWISPINFFLFLLAV